MKAKRIPYPAGVPYPATKRQLIRQLKRQQMWNDAVKKAKALKAGFCITADDASRAQL